MCCGVEWRRRLREGLGKCGCLLIERCCTEVKLQYGPPLKENRKGGSVATYVESNSFSSCFLLHFSPPPAVFLLSLFLSLSLSIDNATGKINTAKKKKEGIFLACYYMSCMRKTVFVGKTEMPRC